MYFKQFYLPSLGHASYLVGSEDSGEALVLDVRRDVETYFAEAREQGMRIRYACDFSGGALLVGDLARLDLLGGEDETRRGAESCCETLQHKILPLPDFVEVFPTHVAGSLCGGNIGSRLSTTIGYERRLNQVRLGSRGIPDE